MGAEPPTAAEASPRAADPFEVLPLPGATFGGLLRFAAADPDAFVADLEARPDALPRALAAADGLLLVRGLTAIADRPALLLRLSRLLGPEVEDYRQTLTESSRIHATVPEIFIVSNLAPVNQQPPPRPDPPRAADGSLPVQFPHRRGWHTDQSYRRPPPDVSLFYAVTPAPPGQGQTLYADGTGAYDALPADLKARIEGLEGIHVKPGAGRSEQAVRAGETPRPLLPHEQPQRQPIVRVHPVTGRRALYLCEAGQMDWLIGPVAGLAPGPDGEGAALVYRLMTHVTQPRFTYVQEWERGDLIIYDNRCVLHCATWFDAAAHSRVMWRTTVTGNPGPAYAGERRSWIPRTPRTG